MYIARLLEKASDEETRENLLRATAVHAPVAWGHINMLGEYDFAEEKLKDVLEILPPRNLLPKTVFKTGGRDRANFIEKQNHTRNSMMGFVPLF